MVTRAIPGARAQAIPAAPDKSAAAERNYIWPCLAYLTIEFGRPQAWVTVLDFIKPGMLAAIWGIATVLFMKDRPRIPKPVKYMLVFLALMAWEVPWAMNNRWALWGLQDYAILLLGGVVPLAMIPSRLSAVRILMTAYVALHVPMALHGLLHQGTGQGGWVSDENDLALALNAALGVGVFLFLETRSLVRRAWLLGVMGLLLAGVVATLSRGGFVGLATLGAYVFVVSPPRRRLLVVACLVLAILGLFIFAPAQYWSEVRSIETSTDQTDTGWQRLYLWGMAWRMFLDHPVWGVGTRNFGIQAPFYEDVEYAETGGYHVWGRVCHSMYFTLIAEQGLIGVILFVLTLKWTFSTGRRLKRHAADHPEDPAAVTTQFLATGLTAGVVGVLVTGAFLTVLYYPVLWVLVAFLAALDRTTNFAEASNGKAQRVESRPAPGRFARRLAGNTT